MYKVGDVVKIKRQKDIIVWSAYSKPMTVTEDYTTKGTIADIFDSMDKSQKCFYIKETEELITEDMLS